MILARPKRSAATAWLERVNPLQGLTIAQAKSIFDVARAHGSPLLQKIYEEIELTDPILMTCVDRRQSALAGLGWRAVANASAADPDAAERQRRALEEFASGIENLDAAIEHLDLAFFRGYSVCQPVWTDGTVRTVNLLDSWNFLRGDNGELLWNPECTLDPKVCETITPAARIVALKRRRAIDWPALSIYIRKYVGERDWGRFLERYGIPPVDVIMAPNATDTQRDEYLACAEAAKNGSSVAYPAGTSISRAETSRGQDPFTAFIEHQEKLIVLMATGGTLTSLAQADTGSLAGGAQMDVWEQIVQRDGVVISAALNRNLFIPFLRERFPGEPVMAHFEIGKEDEPSATEAADLAGKLKVAGWRVDQSQLEEQTGFKLEREEAQPQDFGGQTPFLNKAPAPRPDARPSEEEQPSDILAAFAKDTGPAAEAVAKLLQNPSPEAAKALLNDLPSLIPEDPALAAVIAEAMAAEFRPEASAPSGATEVKNKEDQPRGKTSPDSTPGSFAPTDGGVAAVKEKTEEAATANGAATDEQVKAFLDGPIKDTDVELVNALLTKGFSVTDGAGNEAHFGLAMKKHLEDHDQSEADRRKRRLRAGVELVKTTSPVQSARDQNVSCYFGAINGKHYLVLADKHGEIQEVFDQFRRDKWENK